MKLSVRQASDQSSLWVTMDLKKNHADSEDCDQTEPMPKLIAVSHDAQPHCHISGFLILNSDI